MTADRWPRCPRCDAVYHDGFPDLVIHRPGCEYVHTDPKTWSSHE
jgi:uncharacterized C2H2 Zn-finger protein